MSTVLKVLVGLLLTLPPAAYIAGALVGPPSQASLDRDPAAVQRGVADQKPMERSADVRAARAVLDRASGAVGGHQGHVRHAAWSRPDSTPPGPAVGLDSAPGQEHRDARPGERRGWITERQPRGQGTAAQGADLPGRDDQLAWDGDPPGARAGLRYG